MSTLPFSEFDKGGGGILVLTHTIVVVEGRRGGRLTINVDWRSSSFDREFSDDIVDVRLQGGEGRGWDGAGGRGGWLGESREKGGAQRVLL